MTETTPDTIFHLFLGYTVIWLLVVGYIYSLGRRISSLETALNKQKGEK